MARNSASDGNCPSSVRASAFTRTITFTAHPGAWTRESGPFTDYDERGGAESTPAAAARGAWGVGRGAWGVAGRGPAAASWRLADTGCSHAIPVAGLHRRGAAAGAAVRRVRRAHARLPAPRRRAQGRRHPGDGAAAGAGKPCPHAA